MERKKENTVGRVGETKRFFFGEGNAVEMSSAVLLFLCCMMSSLFLIVLSFLFVWPTSKMLQLKKAVNLVGPVMSDSIVG